jgi:hypothetical protein
LLYKSFGVYPDVFPKREPRRSGLFALDRYHPTLREIGMRKCSVEFNQSIYEALDETGKPVATINEIVHRSVITRYGATAQMCSDDLSAALFLQAGNVGAIL